MSIDRETARAAEARYREKNVEMLKVKAAVYRAAHREYFEDWRALHKDYHKKKNRAWYLSNKQHCKEKNLDNHLKRQFGISLDNYRVMLKEQDGKCAICKRPPRGKHRLHVDHNHKTNQVRALLCHGCNAVLGYMDEDAVNLVSAIEYLRKWGN